VREQVPERDPLIKLWKPTRRRNIEVLEELDRGERHVRLVDAPNPRAMFRCHRLARLQVREARARHLPIDVDDCASRTGLDNRVNPWWRRRLGGGAMARRR
jgi:hypothetical protein